MIGRRAFLASTFAALAATPKKVVFLAGRKSHPFGAHDHPAGCAFLAKRLEAAYPGLSVVVVQNAWPADESVFDGASAVVLYMDGGARHPMLSRLPALTRLVRSGVGVSALHYSLDIPAGEAGSVLTEALGGYYEQHWSVNPMWSAHFKQLPDHPVTRGVKPFSIHDEWYFHMRFREGMKGVTPILTAVPPDAVRMKPFGPHSGNETVRAGLGAGEHVAWVYDRPGGGRGFGFTGLHYLWCLGDRNLRNIVLNGIAWSAGLEVPKAGVSPADPEWSELSAGVAGEPPAGFGPEEAKRLIRPRE